MCGTVSFFFQDSRQKTPTSGENIVTQNIVAIENYVPHLIF